jgi:hypothetical protein
MPDAPPAIIPSAAVAASSGVVRARIAPRHAGHRLRRAEGERPHVDAPRARERDRQPHEQRPEQVRRRQPGGVQQQAAGDHRGRDHRPDRHSSHRATVRELIAPDLRMIAFGHAAPTATHTAAALR